jgi:hypothetical protein
MKRIIVSLLFLAFSAGALAQNQVRVRANVVSIDGNTLTVRAAAGNEIKVQLTDKTSIGYPKALKISDIKSGDFIGSAAVPGPGGKLIAREVHVFPEAQRGVGEGHNPWDLEPGATMTNAGVSSVVNSTNGKELSVQYKGGEKIILVPDGTPIITFMPGDRSLLVPGVYVFIGARTAPDGTATAQFIQATSKDGVKPPI